MDWQVSTATSSGTLHAFGACALYDLLGDEVKMGLVTVTPEAEEVV